MVHKREELLVKIKTKIKKWVDIAKLNANCKRILSNFKNKILNSVMLL